IPMRSQTHPALAGLAALAMAAALPIGVSAADGGPATSSENLWQISKNHLKDPFRWPSVWRTTPQSGSAAEVLGLVPAPTESEAAASRAAAPAKVKTDWRASEEKRTRAYLQKV